MTFALWTMSRGRMLRFVFAVAEDVDGAAAVEGGRVAVDDGRDRILSLLPHATSEFLVVDVDEHRYVPVDIG